MPTEQPPNGKRTTSSAAETVIRQHLSVATSCTELDQRKRARPPGSRRSDYAHQASPQDRTGRFEEGPGQWSPAHRWSPPTRARPGDRRRRPGAGANPGSTGRPGQRRGVSSGDCSACRSITRCPATIADHNFARPGDVGVHPHMSVLSPTAPTGESRSPAPGHEHAFPRCFSKPRSRHSAMVRRLSAARCAPVREHGSPNRSTSGQPRRRTPSGRPRTRRPT